MPRVKPADRLRRLRLHHHRLLRPEACPPEEIVAHFGAMQAQDFGMAKWAVALRGADLHETDVAAAFDAGRILRTHVLRPTWHFVAPRDLRWMVQLTAPRVRALLARQDRLYGIDVALRRRSRGIIERALRGGRHLTRDELQTDLARRGINVVGTALAHVMMHAELDGLICSGPRRDRQFTYALVDERVPVTPPLERAAALAELARRYFQSHGPATAQDFSWWSGLMLADARRGIAALGEGFDCVRLDGREHHFPTGHEPAPARGGWLLPNYDEFTVGYADRSLLVSLHFPATADPRADPIFKNVIVVDGLIVGTWQRRPAPRSPIVALAPFAPLSPVVRRIVDRAAERYRVFASHQPKA